MEKLSLYTVEFEVKEKEEEILRKQLEIELNETALNAYVAEKNILYVFLIGAFIIVLLFLFFLSSLRKQKNLLAVQNQEMAVQKETISKTNLKLNELLEQREALLKEVNHRVKNNLTVLSSLLYLQDESVKGKEAKDAIKISLSRVHSIALIHESLYQEVDAVNKPYQEYVNTLFEHIKSIYWAENKPLKIKIELENFQPTLEDSVPIGMILNELITNSFKYAFAEVFSPLISIRYQDHCLEYYDNGPGFSPTHSSDSLGLKLISTFAMQLDAEVAYKQMEQHTHTLIQFHVD